MKCILMNKNTEVLVAEYKANLGVFTEIYEINNIKYAPVIVNETYKHNKDIIVTISDWFRGRGIPTFRDALDLLLIRLNVSTPEELLDKAFGLSLSDQYWIKPFDSKIKYGDINFFEHDFDSADFTEATFSNNINKNTQISLISPNNTTDGRLKKTWIIENNKRYLLKGGFKNEVMQPFNEVLASMICNRLGFQHTNYDIEVINDKIVSKCECFINCDTELVTAYQVLHNLEKNYENKDYEKYIKILEKNGIENAREKIENMFILDYIIMNEDRHLNNFGIIRDVNTLKWLDVAPIFDNGQSLNIVNYNDDEIIVDGQGRFFYNVDNFENIIKNIDNIKRIDINLLDGIVEEFDDLLHKYQYITKMSENRIYKLCVLLNSRINKLKKIIETNN